MFTPLICFSKNINFIFAKRRQQAFAESIINLQHLIEWCGKDNSTHATSIDKETVQKSMVDLYLYWHFQLLVIDHILNINIRNIANSWALFTAKCLFELALMAFYVVIWCIMIWYRSHIQILLSTSQSIYFIFGSL